MVKGDVVLLSCGSAIMPGSLSASYTECLAVPFSALLSACFCLESTSSDSMTCLRPYTSSSSGCLTNIGVTRRMLASISAPSSNQCDAGDQVVMKDVFDQVATLFTLC